MVQCTHWSQDGAPETAFVRYAAEAPIKCSRCGTEVVEQATVAALRAALEQAVVALQFWPHGDPTYTLAQCRQALAATAPAAPGEPQGETDG